MMCTAAYPGRTYSASTAKIPSGCRVILGFADCEFMEGSVSGNIAIQTHSFPRPDGQSKSFHLIRRTRCDSGQRRGNRWRAYAHGTSGPGAANSPGAPGARQPRLRKHPAPRHPTCRAPGTVPTITPGDFLGLAARWLDAGYDEIR